MTAWKCKQLCFGDFVHGLNYYLCECSDLDYRTVWYAALAKPQNWQAEAKVGLCRMRDGGNK